MLANAYSASIVSSIVRSLFLRQAVRTTGELDMRNEHFQTLRMLAENQSQLQQFSAAIETAHQAIEAATENQNSEQLDAARFVLANAYMSSGKLAEAEPIYIELFENEESGDDLGAEINRAQAQVMYATVLIQRRQNEEAERYARLGYGTYRRHFGLTTVNTLMAGQNLGAILAAVGKHDEAIETFRHVVDARRRLLGPEHADTLVTAAMLGRSLIASGQEDAGEACLSQALEVGNTNYGERNPIGVLAAKSLVGLYRKRGDFDQAIQSAQQGLRFAESLYGKGDWRVEIQRVRLADLYQRVGNAEQALALSRSAQRVIAAAVGDKHPYARAAAATARAAEKTVGGGRVVRRLNHDSTQHTKGKSGLMLLFVGSIDLGCR